jgi:hypothetical protein
LKFIEESGWKGGDVSLAVEKKIAITYVTADDRTLTVILSDGRRLSLPLEWYPRLKHGTPAERNNWRIIGRGEGINWPDLDEDLSLDGFLAGRQSVEKPPSIRRWLAARKPNAAHKRRQTA